jgi:hypothetical protein
MLFNAREKSERTTGRLAKMRADGKRSSTFGSLFSHSFSRRNAIGKKL